MFTGIIKNIGIVRSIKKEGDWVIMIEVQQPWAKDPEMGASIACSGVCLTVMHLDGQVFGVQASEETLSKTNIEQWQEGSLINLERSLCMGDELGGHLVFGHVDGVGQVQSIKPVGDSHEIFFNLPPHLIKYMANKGSVSINGVSLTVNNVSDHGITVNIIPHTWEWTDMKSFQKGTRVNVEIDMLARYVYRVTSYLPD